jgi:hypothetical protein
MVCAAIKEHATNAAAHPDPADTNVTPIKPAVRVLAVTTSVAMVNAANRTSFAVMAGHVMIQIRKSAVKMDGAQYVIKVPNVAIMILTVCGMIPIYA